MLQFSILLSIQQDNEEDPFFCLHSVQLNCGPLFDTVNTVRYCHMV